jgi:hypothetical protein
MAEMSPWLNILINGLAAASAKGTTKPASNCRLPRGPSVLRFCVQKLSQTGTTPPVGVYWLLAFQPQAQVFASFVFRKSSDNVDSQRYLLLFPSAKQQVSSSFLLKRKDGFHLCRSICYQGIASSCLVVFPAFFPRHVCSNVAFRTRHAMTGWRRNGREGNDVGLDRMCTVGYGS